MFPRKVAHAIFRADAFRAPIFAPELLKAVIHAIDKR
jgi:hypothetical protein